MLTNYVWLHIYTMYNPRYRVNIIRGTSQVSPPAVRYGFLVVNWKVPVLLLATPATRAVALPVLWEGLVAGLVVGLVARLVAVVAVVLIFVLTSRSDELLSSVSSVVDFVSAGPLEFARYRTVEQLSLALLQATAILSRCPI